MKTKKYQVKVDDEGHDWFIDAERFEVEGQFLIFYIDNDKVAVFPPHRWQGMAMIGSTET